MKKKVLILHVDDDPDTLTLVHDVLGSVYDADSARSGKECLAMLHKKKYDGVLLDVLMPDMSGWDVYQQIRKTDKKLKVAFLSAIECSKERLAKLKKEGVADYITKPISPAELKKRVAAVMKK
ncbi:MAG: response regulator [Nanoarchaeota archaeon]|nr:response regulator [Nanoarchaeota archaeon]